MFASGLVLSGAARSLVLSGAARSLVLSGAARSLVLLGASTSRGCRMLSMLTFLLHLRLMFTAWAGTVIIMSPDVGCAHVVLLINRTARGDEVGTALSLVAPGEEELLQRTEAKFSPCGSLSAGGAGELLQDQPSSLLHYWLLVSAILLSLPQPYLALVGLSQPLWVSLSPCGSHSAPM